MQVISSLSEIAQEYLEAVAEIKMREEALVTAITNKNNLESKLKSFRDEVKGNDIYLAIGDEVMRIGSHSIILYPLLVAEKSRVAQLYPNTIVKVTTTTGDEDVSD